ncbi:MAG: ankyrin repeat domain-containing protein, partial [Clostridia bacterium]|nr:ankyrin repeat domain-containing protein [Clostridia bacterium]
RINKLNKAITPDELKETFNTALSKDNLKELEKQFKYTSAENLTEFLKAPLDDNANTALHLAVLNNKPKLTELLIKNGADPYAKNTSGTYPLLYAAKDIKYKDIFYILSNGKFNDPIIREAAEKSGIWPLKN